MACDGALTTLQFTTQTTLNTFEIESIEGDTQEIASVEKNPLAAGKTEYCPGTKETTAPFTVTGFFTIADAIALAGAVGVVDTITITYDTDGTKIGTGFIQSVTGPGAVSNEQQMMTFTIQWDQKTGPDYATLP